MTDVMPDDVDLLAVLAEETGTPNPIDLISRLEARGLSVSVKDAIDFDAQRQAMMAFGQTMEPIWEQTTATRNRLIGDGWSEEMAEHLAGHVAHIMFAMIEREMFGEERSEEDGHGEQG